MIRRVLALAALALATAPTALAADNPWLGLRVLNIAHQGGEAEAPSNTNFAYRRSLELGSDMLEVDVHSTVDGRLVVMHDGTVDRTTEGTGSVYEKTLAEIQALDAAYDFVPGEGTKTGEPESAYAFRGIRTGDKPPPRGFGPEDFRIPTLEEVLLTYPDIPINIEIKGAADTDVESFMRNATLLAEELQRLGRSQGVIVASFNDAALAHFHQLAPEVGTAPAVAAVATFKLGNVPPPEGTVAFQVPITFSGIEVTNAEFVQRAHDQGYAVHVWLSGQTEDKDVYRQLLDWNVDGIMAAKPTDLEQVLCERGVARPQTPGVTHCPAAATGVCAVRPVRLSRAGRRGVVRLRIRREGGSGRCSGQAGLTRARRAARGSALARRGFTIPAGRRATSVRLRLARGARRALRRRGSMRVRAWVRAEGGTTAAKRFRLRPRR